jgi:hypothetical protein
MQTLIEPLELEAGDDGLAVVLGKKGQAIRLTFSDTRHHVPAAEPSLARYAGSPRALMLGDKPANADRLIEQFIAEETKKRGPVPKTN